MPIGGEGARSHEAVSVHTVAERLIVHAPKPAFRTRRAARRCRWSIARPARRGKRAPTIASAVGLCDSRRSLRRRLARHHRTAPRLLPPRSRRRAVRRASSCRSTRPDRRTVTLLYAWSGQCRCRRRRDRFGACSSRPSVSALSVGRTDPSATRDVRAYGDEQVRGRGKARGFVSTREHGLTQSASALTWGQHSRGSRESRSSWFSANRWCGVSSMATAVATRSVSVGPVALKRRPLYGMGCR